MLSLIPLACAVIIPAAEPPAAVPLDVSFKDGFSIASSDGAYRLRLGGLLQPRAELQGDDVSTAAARFALQRAQIDFGGNVFNKDLGYFFKLELGQGFPFLKDGYVNYAFVPGVVELRVGQFKRPFSRTAITSDWRGSFVDRGEDDAFFKDQRDVGVVVHDGIEKSPPIEYSAGLFGGATDKPTFPVDGATAKESNVAPEGIAPTLVGRVGYNLGDVRGYDEIDTTGGDVRFGVAVSALETVEPLPGGKRGATRGEIDGIVKVAGFDASGALYASTRQKKNLESFAQEAEAVGVHAQGGYLIADIVHPGFRYDLVSQADGTYLHELTAGLVVFVFGQNVAVAGDTTAFVSNDPARPAQELRARVQLSLQF